MVSKLLWLSIEVVSNCSKPFISKNSLLLSVLKCKFFYTFFEADKRAQDVSDRGGETFKRDFLIAAGARHEGEGDSESCPLVLEELNETISVEDMSTRELGTCFSTKLACIAYCAQLILIDALKVTFTLGTLSVDAR